MSQMSLIQKRRREIEGILHVLKGGIRCRPPAFTLTLDTISLFEPVSSTEDDGITIMEKDPNQPPLPCPPEYLKGDKVWEGKDGNQWRFNVLLKGEGKWINVAGPTVRGKETK